jgi:hypothetical protein
MKKGSFFFEKKNQKTFVHWRTGLGWRVPQVTKVFFFFSSEKKSFSFVIRNWRDLIPCR